MDIGIVGAGAMGSIFAFYLRKAGFTVRMYDTDPETVAAMGKGLFVEDVNTAESVDITVDNNPDILRGCGSVFIFVKSYATENAAKDISVVLSEDIPVITLQNGLGNRETLSRYFDNTRIIYGSTSIGAAKKDPGTVIPGGMGDIIIGGGNPGSLKSTADILDSAGLKVTLTDSPDTVIWKKVIVNAGINPLGALLNVPNGSLVKDENTLALQERIITEAVQVARSLDIDISLPEMISITRDVCMKTGSNRCSMLQDITACRKTEIDSINGAIVGFGRDMGIPTPVNESLHLLIRAREGLYS